MIWTGYVKPMRDRRVAYKILIGFSEGKKQLGKTMNRWKNNIKMDFKK
jgi:hypothetical protein